MSMPWEKSLNSGVTGCCRLLSAVVMTDDVSNGCCLIVHLWSSSHTYIVKNVHDNILCLYPFWNASGGSANPRERIFPIAVPKHFYIRDTYFLYSVYFILLIVHLFKNPKISLSQNSHFILLLRTLFSITIF